MRVRTFLIALVLFPICLLLHELSHLGLLYVLGGQGSLIVRPWRFTALPLALPSLHVSGGGRLGFPLRLVFDFGGPGLVGLLALLALRWTDGSLRVALLANAGILFFFAIIETADALLERAGADLSLLSWEEFNYGVPLLLILFAVAAQEATLRPREVAG